MEEEILRFKNKKRNISNNKSNKSIKNNKKIDFLLTKILVVIIITLITLILSKSSNALDNLIKKHVFENTFDFNKYMNKYSKYFTEFIPFENLLKTTSVFNEELKYTEKSKYLDGYKLAVDNSYLVPSIKSGLVVYIGEKEKYGNVVIIQQVDGVDMWYGNLNNINVKLYDYIEEGKLIGDTHEDYLYLVLEREGKYLEYEDYS